MLSVVYYSALPWLFSPCRSAPFAAPAVSLKPMHLNSGSAFLPLRWPPNTQERESACRRDRTGQRGKKGQKEKCRWGRGKGLVLQGSGGPALEIHKMYNRKTMTKTEQKSVFPAGSVH
ncbi:hypothetical protein CHARACLAT_024806 [Characodon lateralis]|uniref:Uncharacterized protein n=1 Tax=Characodon lateralis TaxID=208331 RepID=A0ABU7D9N6_9TELE|nr:hypothetical protein [Characodon lateralis]